ncbi:MAG: hypothetical protein R3A51_01200 [Nannocystaceae bacterium]|nr:hypothetical protein [Myxococcales bacterium]
MPTKIRVPASLFLITCLLPLACGDSGDTTDASTDATTDATTDASTTDGTDTTAGSESEGDACMVDICMLYGAAVPMVASEITDRAANDMQFMDDFAPLVAEGQAAVDAFKASLANFISDAYGCSTDLYTGPTMQEAHAGLGITQMEYDAFLGLIVGVLTDAGVPQDHINDCFAPTLTNPDFAATIIGQ